MSDLLAEIEDLIAERSLLKHSFYTRWVAGTLPKSALQEYARQYFAFEAAFPRVLSAIHTQLDQQADRQAILANLVDEEQGDQSHIELWLRFAEALGVSRAAVCSAPLLPTTEALVQCYRDLAASSATAGLAAVYAYERQVPAVAEAKLRGLADHYQISDEPGTAFWRVHQTADGTHAETEAQLMLNLGGADAMAAAESALDAWWAFLDGVLATAA